MQRAMRETSAPMPTVANVSKVQRAVSHQLTQAKADGSFQATSDFEDLDRELCLYKEALRVTVSYLPQNGHPKKSHAEAFAAALEKLPAAVLEKFPEPVLAQYWPLRHSKDRPQLIPCFHVLILLIVRHHPC